MTLYKVKYEYMYPDSDNDIRDAYIEADSFGEADEIIRKETKGIYETGYPLSIEKIDGLFIKKEGAKN